MKKEMCMRSFGNGSRDSLKVIRNGVYHVANALQTKCDGSQQVESQRVIFDCLLGSAVQIGSAYSSAALILLIKSTILSFGGYPNLKLGALMMLAMSISTISIRSASSCSFDVQYQDYACPHIIRWNLYRASD
jgi:hypothetical protein